MRVFGDGAAPQSRVLGRENVNEKADYDTACGVGAQLTMRLMSVSVGLESTNLLTLKRLNGGSGSVFAGRSRRPRPR